MKRIICIPASLIAALIAVPAQSAPTASAAAAAPATATQPPQPKSAAQIAYENEVVCQKEEVTGSRLSTRRVCLTRGEWARSRMEDKAWVERMQRTGDASSK